MCDARFINQVEGGPRGTAIAHGQKNREDIRGCNDEKEVAGAGGNRYQSPGRALSCVVVSIRVSLIPHRWAGTSE
jgi:hypothetical protein